MHTKSSKIAPNNTVGTIKAGKRTVHFEDQNTQLAKGYVVIIAFGNHCYDKYHTPDHVKSETRELELTKHLIFCFLNSHRLSTQNQLASPLLIHACGITKVIHSYLHFKPTLQHRAMVHVARL